MAETFAIAAEPGKFEIEEQRAKRPGETRGVVFFVRSIMNESPSRKSRPAKMAPWPILSNWPVSRVPEYAYEAIERRHVASRSCLALRVQPVDHELWPDPKAYLFVSFDLPQHRQLARLIRPGLRRKMAGDSQGMDIPGLGTLRELFANMEWKGASAWLMPLHEVGIVMLFLRLDSSDPELKPFLAYNRAVAAPKVDR